MRNKKHCTFAPAKRENGDIETLDSNGSKSEKEEYVPRHIELTAVPMQIGTKE